MLRAIRAFLQMPTTVIGIVTAVMFQLIFGIVWMTGYDGVEEKVKQFHVAVVNEDGDAGKAVAETLAQQLPFIVVRPNTAEEGAALLENRQVQMVVTIPKDFAATLQSPGGKATIRYAINESNPAMVKNVMQGVAARITEQLNRDHRVTASFDSVHPVGRFSMQMVPMMIVLASYVGAMIMCLNVQQSASVLAGQIGRWHQFAARGIINGGASFAIALVGTTLVCFLGELPQAGFLPVWMFFSLVVFTFLSVAQLFLLLMGPAGMVFNILLLSIQLVTSGAMVPRELLSGFYAGVSSFLPATYAVEGMMNLLFGGPSAAPKALALAAIAVAATLAGAAIVAARKQPVSHAIRTEGGSVHGQTVG